MTAFEVGFKYTDVGFVHRWMKRVDAETIGDALEVVLKDYPHAEIFHASKLDLATAGVDWKSTRTIYEDVEPNRTFWRTTT